MIMTCGWCKKEFKDNDEVVIALHDDQLFHEDECFNEWVYEENMGRIYTYKDYRKQEEDFEQYLKERKD